MPGPTYGFSSSATWAAGSGTTQNVPIHASAAVGDLCIIVVAQNGAAANNATAPAGWTKKYQTGNTWGDVYAMQTVFYKTLVSGEPGSNIAITFATATRGGGSSHSYVGALTSGDPFQGDVANESATSAQPVSLSVVTTEDTTLFTTITNDTITITATAPTSFTRRHTTPTTHDPGHVADWVNKVAGTYGVQWTLSANNRNNPWAAGIKGAAVPLPIIKSQHIDRPSRW